MGNADIVEIPASPCAGTVEGTIAAGSAVEDKGLDSFGSTEVDVTEDGRNSYHAVALV